MPYSRIKSPIIPKNIGMVSGQTHDPRVCLTFDDGPDPDNTPRILDLLAEYNIHASFFVLGAAAMQFPRLIERMLTDGHTVGNHTHNHPHPWMIMPQRARDEVAQASKAIGAIAGRPPRWFRPPHGRLRRAMLEQAHHESMTTVLWSHSIVDWGPLGTDTGIAQRLTEIKAGDIVLMHDGARQHNHPAITARQLPGFIESLLARKIQPVTLDQIG